MPKVIRYSQESQRGLEAKNLLVRWDSDSANFFLIWKKIHLKDLDKLRLGYSVIRDCMVEAEKSVKSGAIRVEITLQVRPHTPVSTGISLQGMLKDNFVESNLNNNQISSKKKLQAIASKTGENPPDKMNVGRLYLKLLQGSRWWWSYE